MPNRYLKDIFINEGELVQIARGVNDNVDVVFKCSVVEFNSSLCQPFYAMFQCNRAVDEPYGQIIIDHALLGVNRMIRFKSVSGVIQILVDGLHHDVVEDGFREGHEA